MKNLILAAGLSAIATLAGAQDKPVLTVYTYDSFVSDWGPGPAVEKAFEATCDCDLQLVAAGGRRIPAVPRPTRRRAYRSRHRLGHRH